MHPWYPWFSIGNEVEGGEDDGSDDDSDDEGGCQCEQDEVAKEEEEVVAAVDRLAAISSERSCSGGSFRPAEASSHQTTKSTPRQRKAMK